MSRQRAAKNEAEREVTDGEEGERGGTALFLAEIRQNGQSSASSATSDASGRCRVGSGGKAHLMCRHSPSPAAVAPEGAATRRTGETTRRGKGAQATTKAARLALPSFSSPFLPPRATARRLRLGMGCAPPSSAGECDARGRKGRKGWQRRSRGRGGGNDCCNWAHRHTHCLFLRNRRPRPRPPRPPRPRAATYGPLRAGSLLACRPRPSLGGFGGYKGGMRRRGAGVLQSQRPSSFNLSPSRAMCVCSKANSQAACVSLCMPVCLRVRWCPRACARVCVCVCRVCPCVQPRGGAAGPERRAGWVGDD